MLQNPMKVETLLDDLFPLPHGAYHSKFSPRTWPGSTPGSTESAREMLKDSYKKWHVFFVKDYRPHNHSMHWVLSLWAMGADEEILKEAYRLDNSYLMPKYPSPSKITPSNLYDHLGDQDYFDGYLEYFSDEVGTKGVATALEEHVFNIRANFVPGKEADMQPEMLNRFMDGIIHPLIHTGNGLEFGLPGLVAEAIAWTAVHLKSSSNVVPSSLWNEVPAPSHPPSYSIRSLRFLGLGKKSSSAITAHITPNAEHTAASNTHALTILSRILKDTRFDKITPSDHYAKIYSAAADKHGDAIVEYTRTWTYDRNAPGELERKIEELVWANVVIYGCGGWGKSEEGFTANFIYAHLVTSSIFLPSIAAVLSPVYQELLLRSYFSVCLAWWIGQGRAKFDIPAFYSGTSDRQTTSLGSPSPPHVEALPSPSSHKALAPNAWLSIIRDALVLQDVHIPKTIRALAHWGEVFGSVAEGYFGQGEGKHVITELAGAEKLDGTIFVRVAVLTMEKLVKDRNTDLREAKYWDRKGFY